MASQTHGRNPAMSVSTAHAVYLNCTKCTSDLQDLCCAAYDAENLPAIQLISDLGMCAATLCGAIWECFSVERD